MALPEEIYLSRLMAARLLQPTSVPGIYGRGARFVEIMEGLERCLTQLGRTESTHVWQCPPVLPHNAVEKYNRLPALPHPRVVKEASLGDLVLAPTACYYVYPTLTGRLPAAGRVIDIESWCHRSASSLNPMQMRAFRMREFVHAGSAPQTAAFRESWIVQAQAFLRELGLMPQLQAQAQTVEVIVPMLGGAAPTALLSVNAHGSHLGKLFDIRTHEGKLAHTACVAFGIERLALALLDQYGLQLTQWPESLQVRLGLSERF
jgi:seryl-tRNA synthetase